MWGHIRDFFPFTAFFSNIYSNVRATSYFRNTSRKKSYFASAVTEPGQGSEELHLQSPFAAFEGSPLHKASICFPLQGPEWPLLPAKHTHCCWSPTSALIKVLCTDSFNCTGEIWIKMDVSLVPIPLSLQQDSLYFWKCSKSFRLLNERGIFPQALFN